VGPESMRLLTRTGEPASASWWALGTSIVLKLTNPDALEHARTIVEDHVRGIDHACSRFRADSELELVNAGAGSPVRVGPLLLQAVEVGLRAARLTNGDVNPALGEALMIAGYDRDYQLLEHPAACDDVALECREHEILPGGEPLEPERAEGWREEPRVLAQRTAGWRTIAVDHEHSTIRVGRGVRLDLGATAKALAADRAAHAAYTATGSGVLLSLGGDIALAGPGPAGGWRVFVTDDHRNGLDSEGQMIAIASGGLASSSTTTRRWIHHGQTKHHIIGPDTDAPVDSTWRTVSVAAASCVDANIASTAALVRGSSCVAWLFANGLPARLVAQDGCVSRVAGWPAEPERQVKVSRR
jgi:thiamine biosynthesis lipoprotein